MCEQLKSSSSINSHSNGLVMNDSALRPPTSMAPPVPLKKKISIPSVFLVDDPEQKVQQGNGATSYVRAMDRPPPRPLRPPSAFTGSVPVSQLKSNALSVLTSSRSSSSSAVAQPQQPHAQYSNQNNPSSIVSSQPPRHSHPDPPPRRHQVGYANGSVLRGGGFKGAELPNKCLSVKVIGHLDIWWRGKGGN